MTIGVEVVKARISITLPEDLVEWLDKQVETRKYASRSHLIEVLILEKRQREE